MPNSASRGGLIVAVAVRYSLPLDAALDYAARGWRVFPCRPAGKLPLTEHGFKDATTDALVITAWREANPTANVAIATGAGLVVIDVDGLAGRASLRELEEKHGELPTTLHATTGGDGEHFYFAVPDGVEIRNSAGKLGKGLDIRGDGGYVIAPPSVHQSGHAYAWKSDLPPAPLPAWLLEQLLKKPARHETKPAPSMWSGEISAYAQAALEGEIDAVHRAPEGTRNPTLNTAAFKLGQLVAGGELGEQLVRDRLYDAARAAGLNERETLKTIDSGLRAGAEQPRNAPERAPATPSANGNDGRPRLALVEEPPAGGEQHLTDYGNAERLVARFGKHLRYCAAWGDWLTFDGTRWKDDHGAGVMRRAKRTIRDLYAHLGTIEDRTERRRFFQHLDKSESMSRLNAMVEAARTEAAVEVQPDQLDADPYLLNVSNGTLDLRTGALHEHDAEQLLTKLVPVAYDLAAECPRWDSFLETIFGDDGDLAAYVQRLVGYSLTGTTGAQVLPICFGNGANGKSTFLAVLQRLLGDYAHQAPPELLMHKDKPRGGSPTPELADLQGRRFVIAIETSEGGRLDESLVKQLTGGDTINTRRLYGHPFTFQPTHTLWLATNHKPEIRGTDLAIWRRVALIPFNITIPPERQIDQTFLLAQLWEEAPGILRWALDGCLSWQRDGLQPPAIVEAATADYRAEMDVLAGFLADCCVVEPDATALSGELAARYNRWCEENGEPPLPERRFQKTLTARGFKTEKGTAGKRLRRGLRVVREGTLA